MQIEERAEREAIADMWRATPDDVARALGVRSAEIGGATCVAVRAIPAGQFNRVLALGEERAPTDDELDAIAAFYADDGTPWQISASPSASASGLAARLEARGFRRGYAWQKFVRDPSPPSAPPTDLRIEEIGRDRGDALGRVVVESFGVPPAMGAWLAALAGRSRWHAFVGFDAYGEPAAAGLLWASGGLGWLGVGSTRPAFRRRGGQGAIFAARIAKAVALGATALVTETGVPESGRPNSSYANMERADFRKTYVRENWVAPTV